MQALADLWNRPEYLHTTINHFPLIGLLVAIALLVTALVLRQRTMTLTGLAFVFLMALSAWPVFASGESGFDRVLSMSDEAGEGFLKYHAALAHRWVFLYYLTAGIAALSFGLSWKWPRAAIGGGIVAATCGIAALVAGILIAQAGGKVRHREFRSGPPPPVPEQSHDSH